MAHLLQGALTPDLISEQRRREAYYQPFWAESPRQREAYLGVSEYLLSGGHAYSTAFDLELRQRQRNSCAVPLMCVAPVDWSAVRWSAEPFVHVELPRRDHVSTIQYDALDCIIKASRELDDCSPLMFQRVVPVQYDPAVVGGGWSNSCRVSIDADGVLSLDDLKQVGLSLAGREVQLSYAYDPATVGADSAPPQRRRSRSERDKQSRRMARASRKRNRK